MKTSRLAPVAVLLAACAAGLAACQSDRPKRLFQFEPVRPREPALTAGEVESDGPPTYKVPARRVLYATEFGPVYGFDETVYNPYYGPEHISGFHTTDLTFPSPYFLERSGEPVLHDTNAAVSLEAHASHRQVSAAGDTVSVRLRVRAPAAASPQQTRLNLAIVLDASASMAAPEKAELLRLAAHHVAGQLLPSDRVALVAFNEDVHVLYPAAPADRRALREAIDAGVAFGGGNMAEALAAAYDEVTAGVSEGSEGGHVLLLSDGLLEFGGASGWRLVELARQGTLGGIHLSTVGLGRNLDASLLAALAHAGEGRFGYVETPQELEAVLSAGLRPLLTLYARHVRVRVETQGDVRVTSAYGSDFRRPLEGAREFALPDLSAGEERSVLVRLRFPPASLEAPGTVKFSLSYDQKEPVRRTSISRSLQFEAAGEAGPRDPEVESFARLLLGLDQVRRALEGEQEVTARSVADLLEGDFPALKAQVLASVDREAILLAQRFEYFAARLRELVFEGKLTGASAAREHLLREFYYRRRGASERGAE